MKKVLIFGASGFVGRYLAEEFINHGYKVYGSDCVEPDMLQIQIEFYKVDLLEDAQVTNVILTVEPEIIVNLAAISSVGASWAIPQKTMQVNVVAALNILEASRKLEHKPKVLFVGSSEEYEESNVPIDEKSKLRGNNPYGISKMTQEMFCEIYRKEYGLPIYYVRPFNHTGVYQRDSFVLPSFCKQVAEIEKSGKHGFIKVGNLSVSRDFSDVRDIVRGYRMILENDDCEKIYNIGSGKAYKLSELLEYIVSLSKQDITIEVDKDRIRPSDIDIICCDNSFICEELGWKAEYSIQNTLKDMYEYFLREDK